MLEPTIAGLFDIQARYIRSANLERDFGDPTSLEGYVLTPELKQMLMRIESGLGYTSTQRAWRITGDYGAGKSSFALLLAHRLGSGSDLLPTRLRQAIGASSSGVQLLPVLVTGTREALGKTLLTALHKAVSGMRSKGPIPHVLVQIEILQGRVDGAEIPTVDLVKVVTSASEYAARNGKYRGLLIILDELGKALEFSALNPGQQDVFLLQALAEEAARSGKRPLYVVGLLHQGFNSYSETLSQAAQKEWEKVAGRFDELVLSQPLDQVSVLIADALRVKASRLPAALVSTAEAEMERTINLGWFGGSTNHKALIAISRRLYPLHPTVIPVLARIFHRFGQNERSLFSFLLSNEPYGLQEFASRSLKSGEWFRLNDLFDYTRAAFGHRLGLQSYRSHWSQIESVIDSFSSSEPEDLELLKIVGLLNLADSQALAPTSELLKLSWRAGDIKGGPWKRSLDKLQRQKRILYYRGESAGFCLWPHTSVNLERAYEDARAAIGPFSKVSTLLSEYLEERPIVARRHYIQTGNLRHFSVSYVDVNALASSVEETSDNGSDGRVVIALCDTEEDRQEALRIVKRNGTKASKLTLVAVPRALNALSKTLQQVRQWNWVINNTPELNHDRYAAEEVTRQLAAAESVLRKTVLDFVGLQQSDRPTDLKWFATGKPLNIPNGKHLLAQLSKICDEAYPFAPRIKNELVNRRQLSSAAAAARMRLIERVFSNPDAARLGFPEGKTPPEVSMYLSVLVESKLHVPIDEVWRLRIPDESGDVCNVMPTLERIRKALVDAKGRRIRVSALMDCIRKEPYGVREGLGYLLLAVFAQIYEQDLAFYESGSFLRAVAGEEFMRIVKEPTSFELQFYEMSSVRTELFRRLSSILQLPQSSRDRVELLDVVRPLCQFASSLPHFSQKTALLNTDSRNVRQALLEAREPATLLFETLPGSLSLKPDQAIGDNSEAFVMALKTSLDDLREAYPRLLMRIDQYAGSALQVESLRLGRTAVKKRSGNLLISTTEPRLRAFLLQLADGNLGDSEWLEGIASLVCSKPPSKWLDRDIEIFEREFSQLASSFLRVESLAFAKDLQKFTSDAFRVAITHGDGTELERVIFMTNKEKPAVEELESQILDLVSRSKGRGEAALAQAFWKVFQDRVIKA
jgi:hypothetical protein